MGDLACYNLDVGGEMMAMGCEGRMWEENNSLLSTRKDVLFVTCSSSLRSAHTRGEKLETRP
jgi:hypothetical protein